MLPTTWTPEAARAGVTQEQIEAANERAAQATQANYQHAAAEAQALRRTAQQLAEIAGLSGGAQHALQNALAWPIDPPNIAEAVRLLTAAVEWANSDYRNMRVAPPPPPAPRHQVAEPVRPKALSLEEQIAALTEQVRLLAARVDGFERQR